MKTNEVHWKLWDLYTNIVISKSKNIDNKE